MFIGPEKIVQTFSYLTAMENHKDRHTKKPPIIAAKVDWKINFIHKLPERPLPVCHINNFSESALTILVALVPGARYGLPDLLYVYVLLEKM